MELSVTAVSARVIGVPAGIKKFTGDKGVNVWYETQREPDFAKSFPLIAPRGRMIVMAGRAIGFHPGRAGGAWALIPCTISAI